jgi:hypothetical protein
LTRGGVGRTREKRLNSSRQKSLTSHGSFNMKIVSSTGFELEIFEHSKQINEELI